MTLEDFFTLTEMKDGLTDLARVEELVRLMRKESNCVVKNFAEAARQWSAVASTLAATGNKDSLGLFIQLDGLRFVNHWLQEAQKCCDNTSDCSVEESIIALLGALAKLPIDQDCSTSSGIVVTVKNLFGYKSSGVQDRARALFDSWTKGRDTVSDHSNVDKDGPCCNYEISTSVKVAVGSGSPEHSAVDISSFRENGNADNHVLEPAGGEILQSRSSDGSVPGRVGELKIPTANNHGTSCKTLILADKDNGFQDTPAFFMLNPGQENLSIKEKSSILPAEGTPSTEALSSPVPGIGDVEGKSLDVPKPSGFTDDVKGTNGSKRCTHNLGLVEVSSVLATSGPACGSSTSDPPTQESVKEPAVPSHVDVKESDSSLKRFLDNDTSMLASKSESKVVDFKVQNNSKSIVMHDATSEDGDCRPNVLQDLSSDGGDLRKPENPESSFRRMEDTGSVKDGGESIGEVGRGEGSVVIAVLSKLKTDTKDPGKVNHMSETELNCGIDDAPEVAWQAAKELEHEAGNFRQPFCRSSEKKNCMVEQPGSPDSVNGKPIHGMAITQNLCGVASPRKGEEHLTSSNNMDAEPEDCKQDTISSLVTENAQEVFSNSGKGMLGFDLNDDIHPKEPEYPNTPISAPVSFLASSRPAAVPGVPVVPRQFEGALGQAGSAVTSAYCSAYPQRTLDGYKTVSVEGSSYSSKQRQDLLEIDLNVAEGDLDGAAVTDQIPASSGLLSGESSIEVSSRRAQRLNLDLNRVGDNDDAPSSHRREAGSFYHHLNGHHSPSPSASSSSSQPFMAIDLNEDLSFINETYDQQTDPGQSSWPDMNACGRFKPDDPVISIMGTRVQVNRKDSAPPRSFLPNQQLGNSAVGTNLARPQGVVELQHAVASAAPLFGYNGLTMGPSISLSAVGGPGSIPYMVDLRGAPVVPQIMSSATAFPRPYYSQPFLLSMNSPPFYMNEVGHMGAGFDLNSSLMMVEGRTREVGGLRPGQSQLMEECMWSTSQGLSSGVGVKRKEPDGGREPYPVDYKQQQLWR